MYEMKAVGESLKASEQDRNYGRAKVLRFRELGSCDF